ncbi:MAG: AEC family transporter [Methyloligellaceae bacterium]
MLEILLIVIPVFLVVGIGYFSVKAGYLSSEVSNHLNSFAVKVAVPALLFRAMYKLNFSQAFEWKMLVAFYAGAFLSFTIGIMLARSVWKRPPGEAIAVGFCALFSNTVLLGLPIIERAYGAAALAPVFAIISFHTPTLYPLGIISMELSRRDGRPMSETLISVLKSISTNSLIIAVTMGTLFNLTGVIIPEPVFAAINMLAAAAIPAALVGIGTSLTQYSLKSEISESLAVTVLSLILHPAIAFLLSYYVFGLPGDFVRAATILASMPPGVNVYIFATMYGRAVSLSASSILIATPISIVSISIWLSIMNYIGL